MRFKTTDLLFKKNLSFILSKLEKKFYVFEFLINLSFRSPVSVSLFFQGTPMTAICLLFSTDRYNKQESNVTIRISTKHLLLKRR